MITNQHVEPTVGRKKYSDGFSAILREAHEFFNENNIQMVSGFNEILAEETLFESYKERLNAGLSADEAEQLEQIMENARVDILKESSINGIAPIAGLSMPTVRKMWLKTALKNGIPTEAAKYPMFKISYLLPYLLDEKNEKHYLPEALRTPETTLGEKVRLTQEWIELSTYADGVNLIELSGGSTDDVIDPIFFIESVKLEDDTVMNLNVKLSLDKQIYKQFTLKDDTVETLFGSVDCMTGDMLITSFKQKVKAVKVKGWFSSENNQRTTTVSFEIKTHDVNIGTGSHFDALLPIEMLQDTMALYNIDGSAEMVDIMSQTIANKLDQEIYQFLKQSFESAPVQYAGEFDVKPMAGFAGTPTEWRKELKTTIEFWGTKMKQVTAYNKGYFVIMGNRLDVNLLPDINWTFRGAVSEKGGVTVDYDLGAVTYNNAFQIIASDLMPQGELRMFFVPTENDKMTYKYFPYSFNVERGYRSPKNVMLPSLMCTKRHTIEELIPCQCVIRIKNNDGSLINSYAI